MESPDKIQQKKLSSKLINFTKKFEMNSENKSLRKEENYRLKVLMPHHLGEKYNIFYYFLLCLSAGSQSVPIIRMSNASLW